MSSRSFGVLIFVLLTIGVGSLGVLHLLAYVRHSLESKGTVAVAAGFGVLMSLVPFLVLVGIPVCFALVFLAFRSRRR